MTYLELNIFWKFVDENFVVCCFVLTEFMQSGNVYEYTFMVFVIFTKKNTFYVFIFGLPEGLSHSGMEIYRKHFKSARDENPMIYTHSLRLRLSRT